MSHTGFGGVAYAMAIICVRLESEGKLASGKRQLLSSSEDSYFEAREKGDYRDILSLTRVLVRGPESKSDVDIVIERFASSSVNQIFCVLISVGTDSRVFKDQTTRTLFSLHLVLLQLVIIIMMQDHILTIKTQTPPEWVYITIISSRYKKIVIILFNVMKVCWSWASSR